MDRRTAILAFPGVVSAFSAMRTPTCDQAEFIRCYHRYAEARAVADAYLESDAPDEAGFDVFDRLRLAAKSLMMQPAPTIDALQKKLGCFHAEEMHLGTTYGAQVSHSLANDGRRLVGLRELEPIADCEVADEWDYIEDRTLPEDPGFSADEFAERKFAELVERFPDSWMFQSFSEYERLNADLYAVYSVSIDRRFLVASGELLESAMDDHGVKCWGLGTHGDKTRDGFAFVTVMFLEAETFEAIKDQFRVNV